MCFTYVDQVIVWHVVRIWEMCNVKCYRVGVTVTVCVCVSVCVCVLCECVCVSQRCGFLCCTFVGLLKCLRTLHFHVAWSASLKASAQYRNVMLMEHPEGNAIHILLFLYFPAMVLFDKVAMRCILDEPTGTWKENKCSKGVSSVLRDEGLWR